MIIELPQDFTFFNEAGKMVAHVENGILKLKNTTLFEKVMFELTYQMKGRTRCCYCESIVDVAEMTLDHIYPRDFGGPTITNNLLPCCKDCNNQKNNLTEKQYKKYLIAKKQGREKEYVEDLKHYLVYVRKWELYEIPEEWISKKEISEILVKIDLYENYKGKRYKSVKNFYEKYGHFQKPIIVDKNSFLLDGFTVLMCAKNKNVKKLPVIELENVEVVT